MRKRCIGILYAMALFCIVFNACQSDQELNYARYFVNGRQIYVEHCSNCHGEQGQGLGELIPPLSDTIFLKANKKKLSCIIKYGFEEKITVNGTSYQGKMLSEGHLANIDIAQVITYITNSFGNKQGLYDNEMVAVDLKECK